MSIQPYPQQGVAVTCRSFDEYMKMFNLSEDVLKQGPILDIAGGASSFTAEACRSGYTACAVDPMYGIEPELLQHRGLREIESSTEKLRAAQGQYDWSYYGSIDLHRLNRERSLQLFYEHYRQDKIRSSGYYIEGSFPNLPLEDHTYHLVLCSHFLFLYDGQFDEVFHRQAITDMLRICAPGGQIRIYPLMTLSFQPYPYLDRLIVELNAAGSKAQLHPSQLPFIPGSSQMLVISKSHD